MDLIDQKLSEKLKLFEFIDKKYGTNYDQSTLKKKETANNTKNTDNLQKEMEFSNNELYDNIYSDFKTNSYKSFYYSPSSNTLDSNIAKKNHKKNLKKNFRNHNLSNLSRDGEYTNILDDHINKSKSRITYDKKNKSKNLSKLYPPNDSGNRLYNYGYYIKNKINKKRKLEEEKIRKQMTPKILNRSKEMNRDPSKFEERLYYAEKNDTNDSIYNRKRTLSRENINYQNYNNSRFTYHPKLNKKSLLIASKLEPSTLRINKKKVTNTNYVEDKSVIDYYSNLFKDKNNFNHKKKINNTAISPSCGNEKSNELYMKGMQDIKRKEQIYNENQHKKEEEYKNYPFRPKIKKNFSSAGLRINSKKKVNKDDIYKKNKEWKKRLEEENISKKKKYDEIENKKYTFKPEISQLNIKNDVPFIMKNIQQMNEYVNKRRKVLEQKKEEENYKNKKLGLNAINYNVRTTIPKEFDLKTEKRSKSNKKDRDLYIINKKKRNTQAIILTNNIQFKNINGFSYINRGVLDEDCKNNLNNFNNLNNSKQMKFNSSITQSQQEFINAVNELHYTIDKLNI